jgi:hypothetical protein
MSYESRMLAEFAMPARSKVQGALLRTLLKHGGVVKEFATGEEVVGQLADQFQLNSLNAPLLWRRCIEKKIVLRRRFSGIGYFFALPMHLRRMGWSPARRRRLA